MGYVSELNGELKAAKAAQAAATKEAAALAAGHASSGGGDGARTTFLASELELAQDKVAALELELAAHAMGDAARRAETQQWRATAEALRADLARLRAETAGALYSPPPPPVPTVPVPVPVPVPPVSPLATEPPPRSPDAGAGLAGLPALRPLLRAPKAAPAKAPVVAADVSSYFDSLLARRK